MQTYLVSSQATSLGRGIVVPILLIRKAAWLAAVAFPQEQEIALSFNAPELQAVLISAVGLFFPLDGARNAIGIRQFRG